jgi:hypothetical protein
MRVLSAAVLVFLMLSALPALANEDMCSAEYSAEQCRQMNEGGGGNPAGGGGGGGGSSTCPYYMCGNATFSAQSSWGWCEATQTWTDCPIFYCTYQSCVGTNCTPESITCSSCASRQGNNLHVSDCPRTH